MIASAVLKQPSSRSDAKSSANTDEMPKHPVSESLVSIGTGRPSPAASVYSVGRPTVQSLQADIATAVLDASRYRSILRWDSSAAGQPHSTTSLEQRYSDDEEVRGTYDDQRDLDDVVPQPSGDDARSDSTIGPLPHQVRCVPDHAESEEQTQSTSAGGRWESRDMVFAPSRASGASSGLRTGRQVHEACVSALAQGATRTTLISRSASCNLRIYSATPALATLPLVGLLRWDASRVPPFPLLYQWTARAGVVLAATAFFVLAFRSAPEFDLSAKGFRQTCDTGLCLRHIFLSQLPLPVGALLAFLPLGLKRQQLRMEMTLSLVRAVSFERGYERWEVRHRRWDTLVFLLLWLCVVAAEAGGDGVPQTALRAAVAAARVCLVGVFSAVILCLAYAIVCICRSKVVMVDAFCGQVVSEMAIDSVAHEWNMTQAVHRKASADVEPCLLALCSILALCIPLLVVDTALVGTRSAHLLPGFLVSCGIIYALLAAAAVSEKCARVPALINAMSFGRGTERKRQHTVEYITSSAAGFYLLDTRLATSMVVKMMYIWCIVALGAMTRLSELEG